MFLQELPETASNPVSYNFNGLTSTISTEYTLEEPNLTSNEQHTYELIKTSLYEILNIDPEKQDLDQYLNDALKLILAEIHTHPKETFLKKIHYLINKEFTGFSEIFGLTLDPLIKTINVSENKTTVEHLRYKELETNIKLNLEKIQEIQTKLSILCNKELPLNCNYKNFKIKTSEKTIKIEKNYTELETPLTLIQKQLASPEMLAYLWMLIENKKSIRVENNTILNALIYFTPPHAKIYTDLKGFTPLLYTQTYYKENLDKQEYSFVENPTENYVGTNIIVDKENKEIFCRMNKESIKSIEEDNKQIFLKQQGKFYYNLENSIFLQKKGNINVIEQELNYRSKLLLTLARNPVNNADLRKILAIYYENPTAVLQKARII